MTTHGPLTLDGDRDVDRIATDVAPRRSIVVCVAPGAPTDRLAALLESCGAGAPREYFDSDVAATLAQRWGVTNLDEYVAALHRRRSTAEGVFAVILQWAHVRRLHRQVAGVTQLTAARTLPIIDTIAPHARFVHVRDADAVARATRGAAKVTPPPVAERQALIDATDHTWRRWFDDARIEPLTLVVGPHTDVAADDLARQLGLDTP